MSVHGYHNTPPTLTGYQQVYSERGRLFVLPDSLHRAINLHEQPVPPVFQSRRPRPHRIHIARVQPERGLEEAKPRSLVTTVIFGKLADSRASAKRFLKSFISAPNPQDPSKPERPLSWGSNRSTDKLGFGRRPTSGVWEAKRRSTPETMRPNLRHSIAGPIGGAILRPPFSEEQRSASPTPNASTLDLTQRIPDEKPLASGNGVSISIALAEPVLFLQGFDHGDLQSNRSTAMLRGSLHLKVTKPAKIKSVSLRFRGRATTKWPEGAVTQSPKCGMFADCVLGIPPKKQEFEDTIQQMNHTWPFFNAQFSQAEHGSMADHVELYRSPTDLQNTKNLSSLDVPSRSPASSSNTNLTAKELKKLSLQANQSRSFGKGDTLPGGPTVAQKGFRTFNPGDYIYNFELPIDSHMPETIDVDLGSVKYELEAIVERAGAFKANLMGTKEIVLIRTPAEGSLEQVEPIAISRNWEDQMHYDIVISGKSFPLGAQVPIAFKLTPLAKVQCHRVKVFITESVEYYCNNKRVHRMEPTRKLQLFEKRADGPATSTFPGSTMRIISGGGVPYDLRAAAARGEEIPPSDPTNLLGNLGGERNIGPTEMEFSVQLPSCTNMKDKDKNLRLHFDTTYSNIQVHHWIKVCSPAVSFNSATTKGSTDRNAPFPPRCNRFHKTAALRNLHRLSLPRPLLPRHTSKHLPPRLLLSRKRLIHRRPLRMRLSRRSPPPQQPNFLRAHTQQSEPQPATRLVHSIHYIHDV